MKKLLLIIAAIAFLASPAYAGKFTVGSTDKGQFTDLKVTGATSSAVSGNVATIDITALAQTSATAATPVLTLTQADVDDAFISFVGTNGFAPGVGSSVTCYTTTNGTKSGSLKIKVNGTDRYLFFFNRPD